MSYTPGPWTIGDVVCPWNGTKRRQIEAGDGLVGEVYGVLDDENVANAQLIAAAPDLLEACKLFSEQFAQGKACSTAIIDEAIGKAEGRIWH